MLVLAVLALLAPTSEMLRPSKLRPSKGLHHKKKRAWNTSAAAKKSTALLDKKSGYSVIFSPPHIDPAPGAGEKFMNWQADNERASIQSALQAVSAGWQVTGTIQGGTTADLFIITDANQNQ